MNINCTEPKDQEVFNVYQISNIFIHGLTVFAQSVKALTGYEDNK